MYLIFKLGLKALPAVMISSELTEITVGRGELMRLRIETELARQKLLRCQYTPQEYSLPACWHHWIAAREYF